MRSTAWADLLRHIPANLHDNLCLVTAGGVEIAIQAILRVDHEFLAIRGRLSGSTDAGRVYFIPFARIDYVGFLREVKADEFRENFDSFRTAAPAAAEAPVAPSASLAEPPRPEPEPEPTPAAEEPPASNAPTTRVSMPIKSAVLERFRQRSPNGSVAGLPSSNGG